MLVSARKNRGKIKKEKKKGIPNPHVTLLPDCSAAVVLAEVDRIKMNQGSGGKIPRSQEKLLTEKAQFLSFNCAELLY